MPVVITLHGIRTRGEWQKRIAPLIARYGMIPVLLDYGYVKLLRFLNPFSRDQLVKWLRDNVAAVRRDYPDVPISIVAHSLGSYLVARLISEKYGFIFETVLFSGSIVRADYDWVDVLETNRVNYVANYIAQRDIWPKLASLIPGMGRAGVDGFQANHVALFSHEHLRYRHSDYFNPHTFEQLWLPKLVVPQRQMVENLTSLLAQAVLLIDKSPESGALLARTRLFYRPHGEINFLQFPGMHFGSAEQARYNDGELNYAITQASTHGAMIHSPRAFAAAFTGVATEWTVGDERPRTGRTDALAMVVAPLFSPVDREDGVIGVIALEVLGTGTGNHSPKVNAIKPLVPELSKLVAMACVGMQPLFTRYWL